MATADPMIMPRAREMLACLEQEIAKVLDPPLYVQLRTGAVVDHLISENADECCSGLAWVRPGPFWPSSDAFPGQDEAPQPKGVAGWAITLELGVIRCMPTPDAGDIPTAADWDATTQAVMDDAAAMRRAICCFIDALPGRAKNVLPGIWQPLDISGGCVGGVIPVTLRAPACDCSEAGPES